MQLEKVVGRKRTTVMTKIISKKDDVLLAVLLYCTKESLLMVLNKVEYFT